MKVAKWAWDTPHDSHVDLFPLYSRLSDFYAMYCFYYCTWLASTPLKKYYCNEIRSFPQEPQKNANILNLKVHSADPLCLLGWCGSRSGPPTSQPPTAPLKSDPDTNNLEVSFNVTSLKISICLVWQFGVCCIHLNFQVCKHWHTSNPKKWLMPTLPETNISHPKVVGKMTFLFHLVGYVSCIEGRLPSRKCLPGLGTFIGLCRDFRLLGLQLLHTLRAFRRFLAAKSSPRSWKPKWTKERTSNEPKVQLDVPQGSLYYESKQGTKKVEIPQNYFSFALFDSPKMGRNNPCPHDLIFVASTSFWCYPGNQKMPTPNQNEKASPRHWAVYHKSLTSIKAFSLV